MRKSRCATYAITKTLFHRERLAVPICMMSNGILIDMVKANALVEAGLRDGMPNAVLEAMACGVPVVATPVGGVLDVLKDGTNGIAVNVNDAEMLAEKILELLDDPEKRSRLGKNSRVTIMKNFTPEKELEANLLVYRKILEEKQR